MLLVNASKGPSKIHGIGLIAREFIKRHTPIRVFDIDVDQEHAGTFFQTVHSKFAAGQLKEYSFFDKRRECWVCCGDDARFTNHSDTPNCDFDGKISHANRDIFPEDEITEDYRQLGAESWDALWTACRHW